LAIGLSTYVEVTAVGSPTEFGSVQLRSDGTVLVLAGTTSTGQGHRTSLGQIVAATLEMALDRVCVVESDTGIVSPGDGTSGSRSIQLAGSAVLEAAAEVREQARNRVAEMLEADTADVVLEFGRFRIAGSAQRPRDCLGGGGGGRSRPRRSA